MTNLPETTLTLKDIPATWFTPATLTPEKAGHADTCMCMDCCSKNALAATQTPAEQRAYELKREHAAQNARFNIQRARNAKSLARTAVLVARLKARVAQYEKEMTDAKRA